MVGTKNHSGKYVHTEEHKRKISFTNLTILLAILVMFIVNISPAVYAEIETYKLNEPVNLKLTCTINNAVPSASAVMNITISDSTGVLLVSNKATTSRGNGIFNYTVTFPAIGIYYPTLVCIDGTNSYSDSSGIYQITPDGTAMSGWKMTIDIFASLSTLFLMILFLLLSGSGIKSGMAKAEQGPSKFLFMGLSLIFLIAHILITNIIIHDTLGATSSMASAYTSVMYLFFTVIIFAFLYVLWKVIVWEVDVFLKSKGKR